MSLGESTVESAALGWFAELGYAVLHGPEIAPGEPGAERGSYAEVVLVGRLRGAIARLNPEASAEAREEAARQATRPDSPSLVLSNRRFHRMLVNGVDVEVPAEGGRVRGEQVRLVDFDHPERNDWLVVNQLTVAEGRRTGGRMWSCSSTACRSASSS